MTFIRILLLVILGYFISFLYKKLWKGGGKPIDEKKETKQIAPEEMKQCPYCKTYVPISQSKILKTPDGPINFCSDECKYTYRSKHMK